MKKKTKDSILKVTLATSCIFTLTTPINVSAETASIETKEEVAVNIFPKPQEIKKISTEGMELKGIVDVVLHGTQSDVTVNKVKEVLEQQNVEYVVANEVSKNHATILISADKDHCDDCGEVNNGNVNMLDERQAYILNASNDENEKGEVTIVSSDQDGAYYGVLSLEQMLEQKTKDGKIAEVTISDFPSIKLRGFVEGFYGFPWSFEERLSLIEDSSEFKMNTYIYAPKDDPYHKDKWRDLYPDKEANELRQLAEAGEQNNMSFCWNIHPGYGYNYGNDNDYNKLIAKFEQLYGLGVRQFGISYDDLGGSVNGKQQADLINRVNNEFVKVKGDIKPLIVVGTRYCNGWGPNMSGYFKPFFSTLNTDVEVMWTGANTMSAVRKADYEWPKTQTGVNRNLVAWWNYPVNDYCDGNLMMSPLDNLDTDVDNLNGYFLNPMSQAEASKVAIFSGADYSWNVSGFEKMNSWKRAIVELVPEANEAFERFADNVSYIKDGFEFDESRYLVEKITALNTAIATDSGVIEAATDLKAEFTTMKNDVEALSAMNNKALLDEIRVHLDAYATVAQAGIAGMDAFIAAENADAQATMQNIATLKERLEKAETFIVKSLEGSGEKSNVAKVGEKRIKPMLRDASVQAQTILMKQMVPSNEGSVIGNAQGTEGLKVVLEKGNYRISEAAITLKGKGTFGMKLPKAMNLTEISVTTSNVESLELQYSLNGITWKTADTIVSDGVMTTQSTLTGAFVQIINKTDKDVLVNMNEMIVKPVYAVGAVTASTDLGTYEGSMKNTVDGNIKTKFYSSAGATVGSYARVDLGKEIPLFDAAIYFAGNPKGIEHGVDGFAETKMEISTDGANWKQVGDKIRSEDYKLVEGTIYEASYNANGEMARYIRFTATKASENWVQIFEIPYNKTVDNLGDAAVSLVETTLVGGKIQNLYDNDLSTAYQPTSVKPEDSLTYTLTTTTNVENLIIVQDDAAISNAVVQVKDLNGAWSEIGTLDKNFNTFKIRKNITEVKLLFDGNTVPKLYEIMTTESSVKEDTTLMKSILKSAIDKAVAAEASDSFEKLAPSVQALITNMHNAAQAVYDNPEATNKECLEAWLDLAEALQFLDFQADKEVLFKLITTCKEIKLEDYVGGVEEFKTALANAENVYANANALQASIDAAYAQLDSARNNLEKKDENVDKTILESVIASLENKVGNGEKFKKDASWNVFIEALANAKAVIANAAATQAQVNEALNALTDAYTNIRLLPSEEQLAQLTGFVKAVNKMNRALFTTNELKDVDAVNAKVVAMIDNFDAAQFDSLQKEMATILDLINNGQVRPLPPVNQGNNSAQPNTGDTTNIAAIMFVLLLSGYGVVLIKKKRNQKA